MPAISVHEQLKNKAFCFRAAFLYAAKNSIFSITMVIIVITIHAVKKMLYGSTISLNLYLILSSILFLNSKALVSFV